jgi:hypothetical protein
MTYWPNDAITLIWVLALHHIRYRACHLALT